MIACQRMFLILLILNTLSACGVYNTPHTMPYPMYQYPIYTTQNFDQEEPYSYGPNASRQIIVPETYHMGSTSSPLSHKNQDRSWIEGQNPRNYTIQLDENEKASAVANTLQRTPKNERMAEVGYQRGNKTHYKGLYGSYPSYEAAQSAMELLPADVKAGARVESWEKVHQSINE